MFTKKLTRKIFLTGALIASFFSILTASNPANAEETTLKIMSYNVRNGRGLDDKFDLDRTAATILAESPEVVALQELDSKTKRSGGLDVLEELATRTKMFAEFGPAIDFQDGKYGIGVLSKEKPLKTEYLSLPGSEERRCLLVVEFEKYVFCCSHWSLTEKDRDATVKIATEKMKTLQKPTFICGDFNAEPEENAIRSLARDWTILTLDAPTFPANEPTIRIDYICGADPTGKIDEKAWKDAVREARVVDAPAASDHRPIVVEISRKIFE